MQNENIEVWEKIFQENEWGKYPSVPVIRFIARNFYKMKNRKENVQTEYEIIEQKGNKQKVSTSLDLAKELNKIIAEKKDDTLS